MQTNETPKDRNKRKLLIGAGIVLLIVAFGVLLSSKKPSPQEQKQAIQQPATQAVIEITKDGFVPATITVSKGTTVIWTNKDDKPHRVASNPHPEHDGLPGLDSKEVIGIKDGTYKFTFDKAGNYDYHDHLNPITNGTVIVGD